MRSEYEIVIPMAIENIYYDFGIDFWLQHITATNKMINEDEVIISLKQLGLRLEIREKRKQNKNNKTK